MSNLNKIKEEGEKKFEEYFKEDKNGKNSIGLEYYDAPKKKILDWHNKQMDKAYETGRNDLWETYSKEGGYLLSKKEVIDEVVEIVDNVNVEVFDERIDKSVVDVVEKIVMQTRDVIKQKLLSLKNKEN